MATIIKIQPVTGELNGIFKRGLRVCTGAGVGNPTYQFGITDASKEAFALLNESGIGPAWVMYQIWHNKTQMVLVDGHCPRFGPPEAQIISKSPKPGDVWELPYADEVAEEAFGYPVVCLDGSIMAISRNGSFVKVYSV